MTTTIEHANITVPNIDEAIRFLMAAAPDFHIRKDETSERGFRWVHIGNDEFYFALQEAHVGAVAESPKPTYKNYGVNHIALVVGDIEEVQRALTGAGYQRSIDAPSEKFRKRLYFYDGFGFEWEFIEYLSDDVLERFFYE